MTIYKVKARYFGNTLHFTVRANNLKEAYQEARKESKRLFGYAELGSKAPVVDVRERT